MKLTEASLDVLVNIIKNNMNSFYCKWCRRHLVLDQGVYVHDGVYHPEDYVPECGGDRTLH